MSEVGGEDLVSARRFWASSARARMSLKVFPKYIFRLSRLQPRIRLPGWHPKFLRTTRQQELPRIRDSVQQVAFEQASPRRICKDAAVKHMALTFQHFAAGLEVGFPPECRYSG